MQMTCTCSFHYLPDFHDFLVGRHVSRYSRKFGGYVHTQCLFRYFEPVSPHLAVQMTSEGVVSGHINPIITYYKALRVPQMVPSLLQLPIA